MWIHNAIPQHTVRGVLEKCEADFRDYNKITSDYFAIDRDGNQVDPLDERATAWCIYGIIHKHTLRLPKKIRFKIEDKVTAIVAEEAKILSGAQELVPVTSLNDYWVKARDKYFVHKVFRRAVQTAKELEDLGNLDF
jgi:hypothetical protein